MQHQSDAVQAALVAIRELRQRIEGFVPFEQAGYVHDLFDSAVTAIQAVSGGPADVVPQDTEVPSVPRCPTCRAALATPR
jgi:hypothetical protein